MSAENLRGLRVMAVHAHPDDESITMGGTLSRMARAGADVTVVTCTLGEQGEVIGDIWNNLIAEHADQLGGYRISELNQALAELGVHGEFLGGAGRYRDSGMEGDPANNHPRAFIHSSSSALAELKKLITRLQPHLFFTYGPEGGYGHPDHIQAHQLSVRALADVAEETQWKPDRVLYTYVDTETQLAGLESIRVVPEGWRRGEPAELPSNSGMQCCVPLSDEDFGAKIRAMKAHATQIWIADGDSSRTNPHRAFAVVDDSSSCAAVWALSNLIAQPLAKREFFHVAQGITILDDLSLPWEGLEWTNEDN
ncbi:N-acetyl-1-D-myo-inositol-2-amino-2-deoxy-alpha-D-glucopyranoside deacetylase [Corynebacterium poyangense]|uniref:N-acetyl-1-D-myo-inositol-2-amino-2-deoxy-alpha-D-glucopyranoside deacetylase n=1 Tax=Corynebacterium poyangense TaxID=2684405 RepID=A0A7H0SN59_9CORY|nr:N-acetyl-1-D-myo-inositol-2-amino-2-deoxy-alpha-D-glucopyranoside deacetylase [Corynebacterium poyangense]QNQ89984.1 N-acetyl-1-D-myo-inositol-2-amino-2-deoxy-alpha-D-glucopyranoside deacetylase [Corynebacterium poyangense]